MKILSLSIYCLYILCDINKMATYVKRVTGRLLMLRVFSMKPFISIFCIIISNYVCALYVNILKFYDFMDEKIS